MALIVANELISISTTTHFSKKFSTLSLSLSVQYTIFELTQFCVCGVVQYVIDDLLAIFVLFFFFVFSLSHVEIR